MCSSDLIRQALMFNLRAIICQKLAPMKDGKGRVPVNEVMISNPTIQKLIEEGNEKKIADLIRIHTEDGMCDFNQSLYKLIKDGFITEKTGLTLSHNPEQLKMNLKGIFITDTGIVG